MCVWLANKAPCPRSHKNTSCQSTATRQLFEEVCAIMKDFHFKIYSSILNAAHINNTTTMNEKLSILDCNILCLVRSFYEAKQQCYITNEQLAQTFLVTEKTIKSSLTRLYWRGFIKNEGTKKRILTYQPQQVDQFVQEMLEGYG